MSLAHSGPGAGAAHRRSSSGREVDPAGASSTLLHELTRLRNELKVKDAAIEVGSSCICGTGMPC